MSDDRFVIDGHERLEPLHECGRKVRLISGQGVKSMSSPARG